MDGAKEPARLSIRSREKKENWHHLVPHTTGDGNVGHNSQR